MWASLQGSSLGGAVCTEHVLPLGHEALVGQAQGAPLAGEAVLMPGAALILDHIHTLTKPWGGNKGIH